MKTLKWLWIPVVACILLDIIGGVLRDRKVNKLLKSPGWEDVNREIFGEHRGFHTQPLRVAV